VNGAYLKFAQVEVEVEDKIQSDVAVAAGLSGRYVFDTRNGFFEQITTSGLCPFACVAVPGAAVQV
jgi:hypothetical protein